MDQFFHRPINKVPLFKRGVFFLALLVLSACVSQKQEVSITFGGDVFLARNGEALFSFSEEAGSPWGELLDSENLFRSSSQMAHYFAANLESPLGESSSLDEMNLCADPEQVRLLQDIQIDIVALANNHRGDCRNGNEAETSEILRESQILTISSDLSPTYINTSAGKIAFIAVDDITAPVEIDSLISQIKHAKEAARFVIVSIHWGNEYQAGPTDRQERLANQINEAGADVIWGHHPHVLQKTAWLASSTGHKTLVMYSLGNLIADQWMLEDTQRTVIIRVTFNSSQITRIQVVPLFMDQSSRQLQLVKDEPTKEAIFTRLQLDSLKREEVVVDY